MHRNFGSLFERRPRLSTIEQDEIGQEEKAATNYSVDPPTVVDYRHRVSEYTYPRGFEDSFQRPSFDYLPPSVRSDARPDSGSGENEAWQSTTSLDQVASATQTRHQAGFLDVIKTAPVHRVTFDVDDHVASHGLLNPVPSAASSNHPHTNDGLAVEDNDITIGTDSAEADEETEAVMANTATRPQEGSQLENAAMAMSKARKSKFRSRYSINPMNPTCSLNLICYRSAASGCKSAQIRVARQTRFPSKELFLATCKANPQLITTDEDFFRALRREYLKRMCGWRRRLLYLKALRQIRLLEYEGDNRPAIVPLDSFVLQEIIYAYNHPSKIDTTHHWIEWVYQLRQEQKRHTLEFVEGWNGTRIAVLGTIPLIFSTLVGLIWSIKYGDWQTAFTVAGYILTAGTLLLALLAVVSGIEASSRTATV